MAPAPLYPYIATNALEPAISIDNDHAANIEAEVLKALAGVEQIVASAQASPDKSAQISGWLEDFQRHTSHTPRIQQHAAYLREVHRNVKKLLLSYPPGEDLYEVIRNKATLYRLGSSELNVAILALNSNTKGFRDRSKNAFTHALLVQRNAQLKALNELYSAFRAFEEFLCEYSDIYAPVFEKDTGRQYGAPKSTPRPIAGDTMSDVERIARRIGKRTTVIDAYLAK